MTLAAWIVLVHAFATVAMTGLIWFVQIVHYPLFARVGEEGFQAYEAAHVRATSRVVAPLMLGEVGTAVWLFLAPPPGVIWIANLGITLLLIVWLSTTLLQVPLHRLLERGRDLAVVHRLVRTNWIRTGAWTVRAALALWLVAVHDFGPGAGP